MELLYEIIIWVILFFMLSDCITIYDVATKILSRDSRKVLAIIQTISAMGFELMIDRIIPRGTTIFWITVVAIVLNLICGCINFALYICRLD